VPIISDLVTEPTETFTVTLSNPQFVPPTPAFAGATVANGARPTSIAEGDLNGDGRTDLAVTFRNDGSVSVLLNTTAPGATAPSFATQATFATGLSPFSVSIGDPTTRRRR
jgi:hypothetical protein